MGCRASSDGAALTSTRFQDIEDLSGCGLPVKRPSLALGAESLNVEWAAQLRGDDTARPLYRSSDILNVHLELTTRCNAACPQCSRNLQGGAENPILSAHHSELSLGDVKRILPVSMLRNMRKIYLCGNYGDPAVASECLEVLQYLRGPKGLRVGLFTNGGMRNAEWWGRLGKIMQPKSHAFVRFAIDGDEDTNHLYRQNVDWKRLMDNVQAFISAGGNAEWDFLVFEHNEHQVESIRELAERLGFTKFTAKKTARFIDKQRGVVKQATPVKNVAGDIIRELRPPRAKEWQNEAALLDVQSAVEQHGSVEAYYDTCEIQCKAALEKEIYISAEGLAFPCCWLAGELYNSGVSNADRQLVRLMRAAFPLEGLEALNTRRHGGLAGVVDRQRSLFHQLLHAANARPSVSAGRLKTCSKTCGTQVQGFKKQFKNAQQHLEPSRRKLVQAEYQDDYVRGVTQHVSAPILVWYGSVTGNSERLARRAVAAIASPSPTDATPPPSSREQCSVALRNCQVLVFVLSTWGDGKPPDDVQPFISWLSSTLPGERIPKQELALFGVGSSHWPKFNAAARKVAALADHAGFPALALGEADDAKGDLDGQFEDWLQGSLLPRLSALGYAVAPDTARVDPRPAVMGPRIATVPLIVKKVERLALGDPVAMYSELELAGTLQCGAGDAIGVLPPSDSGHQPRWYSLSSAPSAEDVVPANLRLTVREVRGGLCSPWLCSARIGDEIMCVPPRRPSPLVSAWAAWSRLRPMSPPLLLVAAGAGVAPFISLLDLLSTNLAVCRQKCILWMGCRHAPDALPHSARLQAFVQNGVLHRLVLAESRPVETNNTKRAWVQDKLGEDADEIGRLLFPFDGAAANKALMLVCGSGAMGVGVRNIVANIAARFGSSIEALEQDKRFVAELW